MYKYTTLSQQRLGLWVGLLSTSLDRCWKLAKQSGNVISHNYGNQASSDKRQSSSTVHIRYAHEKILGSIPGREQNNRITTNLNIELSDY